MDRDERARTPRPGRQHRRGAARLRLQAAVGAVAALAALPAAAQVPTPSFDCTRAKSRVEKAICADAGLAAADRRLADLYRQRLAAAGEAGAPAVRQAQQAWLRQRNGCEGEAEGSPALKTCIARAIEQRTTALAPPATPAAPAAPPASAAPAATRPAPPAFVFGPWETAVDGTRCTATRTGPRGRRVSITRERGGADAALAFHPGPRDDDLVRPGERVVFLADQQRLSAIVRDGAVVGVPGEEAAAARALAGAKTLTVVRMLDTLVEVPLDGLATVLGERCGG